MFVFSLGPPGARTQVLERNLEWSNWSGDPAFFAPLFQSSKLVRGNGKAAWRFLPFALRGLRGNSPQKGLTRYFEGSREARTRVGSHFCATWRYTSRTCSAELSQEKRCTWM